ncbi:hypothetical protein AJ79_05945 [Helicocarpus griseus UAMH5409]|uniref:TRIP4/RQT4 C2HC5-type zinc finger domain-containing protein n=1 Tax=Helicocarpus griseus UAMH5409 TaxID=1447875 RepID=A0A2B7XIR9_9EURO|nr:hypothetical protein AJ79_05945 [Helicocarpus griseus UAMH5409]
MLDPALKSWALPRLSALLQLDNDSLTQLLEYTCSLGPEQGAEHLRNMLGDDAKSLEFIVGFGERWRKSLSKENGDGGKKQQQQQQQQQQPGTLISDYLPNVRSKAARGGPSAVRRQQQQQQQQAASSASPSPSRNRNHNPPSGSNTPTTTTTSNIADLTAAIAQLELTTNPTLSSTSTSTSSSSKTSSTKPSTKPRKCTCNATLHPLFTPAPNCLHCGKIICALEGLQPCSFCHEPLLSPAQVQEMIRELRAERGNERTRAHNRGFQKQSGPSPQSQLQDDHLPSGGGGATAAGNDGDDSISSGLAAAKAHRDKLLNFQAQNARRTRVVDEVAEFETPDVHASATQWMTAGQRALALKRQQRVLREMEERGKEEWEKGGGGVVVSLDIAKGGKGGKGVVRLRRVEREREREPEVEEGEEEEEVVEEEADEGAEGKGAFGNNPLLKGGGLVRPVWKGKGKDGDEGGRREQRQTWRRVQDDDDGDNERWILDGGLYGYGGEVEGDGNFCG